MQRIVEKVLHFHLYFKGCNTYREGCMVMSLFAVIATRRFERRTILESMLRLSSYNVKRLVTLVLLLPLAIPVPAQMARSMSYELDYAVVGAAAAATVSANQEYDVVGLVTLDGLSGGVSATLNSDYTISPLIGEAVKDNSSVKFWSIY